MADDVDDQWDHLDDDDDDEDDNVDDEKIWGWIVDYTARRTGVPIKRVEAILSDAGLSAYNHDGIVDAIEIVCHVTGADLRQALGR
jgi:hypothetical protein